MAWQVSTHGLYVLEERNVTFSTFDVKDSLKHEIIRGAGRVEKGGGGGGKIGGKRDMKMMMGRKKAGDG